MNLAKLLVAIGATTSGFQRGMRAAEKRVDALERRTSGLRKGFGRATGALAGFAKKALFLGTVVLVGLAVALGGVTKASIAYEDAFAGVRKTVEATEPELQQLSKDIRQMSTEIPVAATELAGLAETAGALGVPTKNIKEFVRVTAMIGMTTNVSSAEAADALGRLGNILGLTADDYSRFASALVAVGNAGASTEAEILAIARRMGSVAKIAGLSTPQILGWASALASTSGMEPDRAGTSFQMFLLKVTKLASGSSAKLKLLAKTAGLTGPAFKKLFAKDANGALLKFIAGLDKLSKGKKLAVLDKLGFKDSGEVRALLGLAGAHEVVAKQLGITTKAYEENQAAQAELDKRLATTKSQLALLGAILLDIGMTLGDIFLPLITPLVKGLNEWITANRTLIDQIIGQLGAGIAAVASAVGTWIGQNGPLIHQIGTLLWGALTTLWTILTTQVVPALTSVAAWIVTNVVPAVKSIGRWLGEYVIPKVSAFVKTLLNDVIPSVMKVAGPVIGALIAGFGAIVTALFGGGGGGHNGRVGAKVGLIPAIGQLVGKLWGDGKSPLAIAVKAIGIVFGIFAEGIGKAIDKLAMLVTWINQNSKKIGDFLNLISRVGPGGALSDIARNMGHIPAQAAGGFAPKGGVSLVGEEGPELVKWGANGYVTPADLSADAMAAAGGEGGGATYNIEINNPEPRAAERDISRVMRRLEGLGLVGAGG